MTRPIYDPNNLPDGPSEFSWGLGLFPPGVANNLGQSNPQDDFGANYASQGLAAVDPPDGYALMTAMKRTDTLDPDSEIDFETEGNLDRYGPNPPLIRQEPQPNTPWFEEFEIVDLETPRGP